MRRLTLLGLAAVLVTTTGAAPRGHRVTRWPGGGVRVDATYDRGALAGEYRTYYESGAPYELRHYVDGREEGSQQSWTEAGELYLNYDMRDGRRYGLVNAKPCEPVTKRVARLPFYDGADFTPRWTDSVAHQVEPFSLVTQTGAPITERDLAGRIHVASFMFTRCPSICPAVVANLKRVQAAVAGPDVWVVSYSVTPEVDVPDVLASFGRSRGIDPARWRLVTGDRRQIYDLARRSYFADDNRIGSGPDAILHSEKVLLVDGHGRLRGVYNGTLPFDIDHIIDDVRRLQTAG